MSWPAVPWARVAAVSSAMIRHADTEAKARFGIQPLQLMEVAGWQVARFVDQFMAGARARQVVVVAGAGNNGGDALVAARFLHQRGASVIVSLVPAQKGSLASHHAATIRGLGIPCHEAPSGIAASGDLIVDGLLGTGIHPPLRQPARRIIEAMNVTGLPIVAIDVPSGIDADSAAGQEHAVQATTTLTLAAPKPGLALARNAGRVFVADIGLPAQLFEAAADAVRDLYRQADVIELVHHDTTPS